MSKKKLGMDDEFLEEDDLEFNRILEEDDQDDDDDDEFDEDGEIRSSGGSKKLLILGSIGAVILLLFLAFLVFKVVGGKENQEETVKEITYTDPAEDSGEIVTDTGLVYKNDGANTSSEGTGTDEYEEPVNPNGLTDSEEEMLNKAIGIGAQEISQNTIHKNLTPISGSDFTKDYNSTDIPMYYEIKSIRNVNDFISYTKYRATTADGIELYWLDGSYNGKPVRLTTTLSVFKELAPSGVCPVIVEVTVTKDGNQLITGFTVDTQMTTPQKK